ncbi:MAG: thiamine biosynthesis lipoprotein ApbE [Chlamydiales bacterium]
MARLIDALATALRVLGPEQGLRVIARVDRFEALIADLEGEVHLSSGLDPAMLDSSD